MLSAFGSDSSVQADGVRNLTVGAVIRREQSAISYHGNRKSRNERVEHRVGRKSQTCECAEEDQVKVIETAEPD